MKTDWCSWFEYLLFVQIFCFAYLQIAQSTGTLECLTTCRRSLIDPEWDSRIFLQCIGEWGCIFDWRKWIYIHIPPIYLVFFLQGTLFSHCTNIFLEFYFFNFYNKKNVRNSDYHLFLVLSPYNSIIFTCFALLQGLCRHKKL